MQQAISARRRIYNLFTGKKTLSVLALFFVLFVSLIAIISIYASDARAATNSNINFQARVLTSGGAVVPDGPYSVEFRLYNVGGGGTSLWNETQAVTVKNGYITVSLGSVNPFGGGIDWSQELWLSMNINGDGEMNPRMKITAVPYAFRAGQADMLTNGAGTISASQLAQLAPGTIQGVNSGNTAISINQTGAGSLIQLQGDGVNEFTVSKTGDTNIGGSLTVNSGITVGNSTNTTAGTIRWTGTVFEGYNGFAWAPLGGSGGAGSFVNIVKPANEIVNNSAALQDDDHLTFPIGANEEYTFRFVIQANSGATPDLRFAVNAPAGATCRVSYADHEGATSNGQYGCGVTTASIPGNGAVDLYEVTGSVTNGATPGSVTLRWAQFTANASNTTVFAGSYMQAIRSIGAGVAGQVIVQDGNSFGTKATIGTNDNNILTFETNGTDRLTVTETGNVGIGDTTPASLFTVGTNDALQVDASGNLNTSGTLAVAGQSTFSGNIVASGSSTVTTGTTVAPAGVNVTAVNLTTAGAFANNDVIFIDNAGQDYYTRIVSGGGTVNLVVSPAVSYDAGATVTKYNVQNIGATSTDYASQANRFFQGYFLGGVVIGAGSTTISDGIINSTTTLKLQENGGDLSVGGALNVAGVISGDASGLTNINGASISNNSISDGSLSANVTLLGNTFNGANQLLQLNASGLVNDTLLSTNVTKAGNTFNGSNGLVQLDVSGNLPALNASALTSLNGSNVSSGTIADARLSSNVTLLGNTFNGVNQLVQLDASGYLPALNGSALTTLNASNISSGTIADARLTSNVTLVGNTFNGVNQLVQLDGSGNLPALNGSALTTLNASNLSSGTVADNRLTTNVTLLGNTFNGANQLLQLNASGLVNDTLLSTNVTKAGNTFNGSNGLVQLDVSGNLPALNASALTSLNGSNVSSGTIADARLSSNVTLLGNTFNGASQLVQLDASANLPALNASALTSLNGSNVSSGTIADARLTTNVALLNLSQSFSAAQTFSANIVLGNDTASPTRGLITLNDATGSNGFTSVLGTNTLTANRNIDLPDENGTICLSNSVNCGFVLFGKNTAQVDSSTNSSIFINKTGASGNILTLQKNGTTFLNILNSGAFEMRLTDTSALSVKNNGGTDYFSVDTSGGLVRIGSSTADGNATLLVLDTKNTAGDPTGTNGGSYYNSSTNKFRCFQNNAWKDCISETTIRSFVSSTAVAIADNNTSNYWRTAAENNNSYPNIVLSQASGKAVRGIVTIETTATTNNDVEVTARVERGIGAVPTCNAGTQVGAQPGTFSSNNGGQKASTVQFVDVPNTTSTVYYVVCADTATVGTGANMSRIRVTLEEVNNSN